MFLGAGLQAVIVSGSLTVLSTSWFNSPQVFSRGLAGLGPIGFPSPVFRRIEEALEPVMKLDRRGARAAMAVAIVLSSPKDPAKLVTVCRKLVCLGQFAPLKSDFSPWNPHFIIVKHIESLRSLHFSSFPPGKNVSTSKVCPSNLQEPELSQTRAWRWDQTTRLAKWKSTAFCFSWRGKNHPYFISLSWTTSMKSRGKSSWLCEMTSF